MKTRKRVITRSLLLFGTLIFVHLWAPSAYAGTVQVEVRDCDDKLLDGVTIELLQEVVGPPRRFVQIQQATTRNGVVQFGGLPNGRYVFLVNCPGGTRTALGGPFNLSGTQLERFSVKCCDKHIGFWDAEVEDFDRVVFELKSDGGFSIVKQRGGLTFRGTGTYRLFADASDPCGFIHAVYQVPGLEGCQKLAAAIKDDCKLTFGQSSGFQTPENLSGRFQARKRN